MSEENPIRVFVTHVFEETHDYLRVFEFLESDDRFYYLNVSKPENTPTQGGIDAIKEELITQIKESEAIIVLKGLIVEHIVPIEEPKNIQAIGTKASYFAAKNTGIKIGKKAIVSSAKPNVVPPAATRVVTKIIRMYSWPFNSFTSQEIPASKAPV